MKIEAGKWYKTRAGEKVWSVGRGPDGTLIVGDDVSYLTIYHPDGRYWGSDGKFKDIISLWQEPVELPEHIKLALLKSPVDVNYRVESAINQIIDVVASLSARITELESRNG